MPLNLNVENGRVNQSCAALSISPTRHQLLVSIASQQLFHLRDGQLMRQYRVSTSKNPPSCRANSYGTPTGLHAIAEKIGHAQPIGMVFEGRLPTRHFSEYSAAEQLGNLITTRILRLRGLQPRYNQGEGCDSYERYIYLHGTNHEDRIGQPFSGGCVEMLNADIIELFNQLHVNDLVWITEN
jgi:hypothetical protein